MLKDSSVKTLISELKNQKYTEIYEYDMDSTLEELDKYSKDCEFVFHLAGINRPKDQKRVPRRQFWFYISSFRKP